MPVIRGILVGVSFVRLLEVEAPRVDGGGMLLSLTELWRLVVPTEGDPAIVGS